MHRLETFGGLSLSTGDRTATVAHRRRLALLAVLATSGDRGVSRDKILAYFWPETATQPARHSLEQLVYEIRRQLGDSIFIGTNPISLNAAVIGSDVEMFGRALERGEWQSAVELYRGPFLDGFFLTEATEFERWSGEQREAFAGRYRGALERLAERATAAGDPRGASKWWRLLVSADPYATTSTVGLMRALAGAGDHAGALERARVYEALMRTELDAAPHPDVVMLAERLRASHRLSPASTAAAPAQRDSALQPPSVTAVTSPEAVDRARSLGRRGHAVALLVAAMIPAAIWAAHRADANASDERLARHPSTTVVNPFHVSAPDSALQYLGQSIGRMLAERLSGEGGFRAPRVVDGEVLQSGTAGLVLNASARSKPGGLDRIAASAAGTTDSIPQLVDRLAIALLARGGGEDDGRVRILSRVSLPVLRNYLAGRAAYRHGDYQAAVDRLHSALDADSTFALGALALAEAAGGRFRLRPVEPAISTGGWPVELDSSWLEGINRARQNAGRLREADRAYLSLLAGSHYPHGTPALEQLSAWERATEVHPERAELWLHFGELLLHQGVAAGIEDSRSRAAAAFRRAHVLDPGFAGPLLGLIEVAAYDRDSAAATRLRSDYFARDSGGELDDYVRWRVAGIADSGALKAIRERMDSLSSQTLSHIQWTSQVDGVAVEDAERATTILLRRATNFVERQAACAERAHLALNRGRPGAALKVLDEVRSLDQLMYCDPIKMVYYGLYWDGDPARAAEVAEQIRRDDRTSRRRGTEGPDLADLLALAQWDLWHGDSSVGVRLLPELRRAREDSAWYRTRADLLEAILFTVRRDPRAKYLALRSDSLARLGCCVGAHWDNPALARIWENLGDLTRARQAARRAESYFAPEYLSAGFREEARFASLLGDREGAIRAYRHFLALQSAPEPVYARRTQQAREELRRLERGEP